MDKISFAKHISWQILPNQEMGFVFNIRERKYYEFEDTELLVWDIISKNEGIDEEDIIAKVAEYYDIDINDIKDDTIEFIYSLYEIGVIERNGRDKY